MSPNWLLPLSELAQIMACSAICNQNGQLELSDSEKHP